MRISAMSSLLGRYKHDTRGVAAVEFAILAPFLLFLFIGLFEISQAHILRKNLDSSVSTIADLVSRQQELNNGDAVGLIAGFKQLLEPLGPANVSSSSFYIASISRPSDGTVIVDWSVDQDNGEPFVQESQYSDLNINFTSTDSPLEVGASVIVVKIVYNGERAFSFNRFLGGKGNSARSQSVVRYALRWPRRSSSVVFEQSP